VIFVPGRAKRPGSSLARISPAAGGEADACPFCEGHEQSTPPELFALDTKRGRLPDSPGWKVRVVPNLYPAFERQQVVIHSPDHARSLVDLSDRQLARVVEAWARIAEDAWSEGFDHLLVFVNEGEAAGSSLSHSHSQTVWLDREPPQVAVEARRLRRDGCVLCALLANLPPALLLAERELEEGTVVLAVSPAGRAPYELLIAPSEHLVDAFGETALLAAALALVADEVRRLNVVEGPTPFNLWLHNFQGDGHWHLELVPRLSVFAGIELGAGIYVNTLEPEEAAARLRDSRAGS
jgi:UDPglucose--hexose-1-phosphate uridylyltransferase